ncbi:MAG: hypothetical protein ACXVGO_15885, partial [Mycobacterium sp.]
MAASGVFCASDPVKTRWKLFARSVKFRATSWSPALGGVVATTAVVACLPGSQELRYYDFWMISLVTMNVIYLWRFGDIAVERLHFGG